MKKKRCQHFCQCQWYYCASSTIITQKSSDSLEFRFNWTKKKEVKWNRFETKLKKKTFLSRPVFRKYYFNVCNKQSYCKEVRLTQRHLIFQVRGKNTEKYFEITEAIAKIGLMNEGNGNNLTVRNDHKVSRRRHSTDFDVQKVSFAFLCTFFPFDLSLFDYFIFHFEFVLIHHSIWRSAAK